MTYDVTDVIYRQLGKADGSTTADLGRRAATEAAEAGLAHYSCLLSIIGEFGCAAAAAGVDRQRRRAADSARRWARPPRAAATAAA